MTHRSPLPAPRALLIALALTLSAFTPARAGEPPQAPSAERVSSAVTNYTRVNAELGTGGVLREGAIAELKGLGFRTIVDLRGPAEGVEAERRAAEAAGLRYVNIPVTEMTPTEAEVAAFARVANDPANGPILAHCASGNRVGALWTLYRVGQGAPAATALEEGRRIGLSGAREQAIRKQIGAP